jgi:hypothetical protein
MRNATHVTVSVFGAIAALAGIEHGVGEVLQGNVASDGLMILSWPESAFFRILGGEPAMTVVPNLLVSGVLTILFSLALLVWATLFVHRKHGGLVLILLSLALLLVGGGFGPPMLGFIVGIAATRIRAPLTWWRAHLGAGLRRLLAALWPWSLAAGIIAWLSLCPGSMLLDHYVGVGNPELVIGILFLWAMGSLLLTICAGISRDSLGWVGSRPAPSGMSGRPVSQAGS